MSANRLKLNTDKTELLWTGSRHSISQLHDHGPSIQLGADTVPACDHVLLLIWASTGMCPSLVRSSFYWLRWVHWSLDDELAAILVMSRVKAWRSTTTAWHTCLTLSCIGSMWQTESHTSLGWRCTSACMARQWIICLSCVHRSLKLLNDSIFVRPATIYSLFHGFSSIRTTVAPSLSLDQRHGICSKTSCVSRTCKLTVFIVHWRRFFLISTRHIERIRGDFAMMRYINWHLHLLYINIYLVL